MKREAKIFFLNEVANHLIINRVFYSNLGMLHGRVGIIIFFYFYSQFINNPSYEEYTGELIDETSEEIENQLPVDFENGYVGIGWIIEYLAHYKFTSGDINVIFEYVDRKIMECDGKWSVLRFISDDYCAYSDILE